MAVLRAVQDGLFTLDDDINKESHIAEARWR
jgi:hypothetical protein